MPVDPSSELTTLPPTIWPELTAFLVISLVKLYEVVSSVVYDYFHP